MFNLISHQGNTNQNHRAIPLYIPKRLLFIPGVGNNEEKLEPSYMASGVVKWCNCFGKQFGDSSNG